MKTTITINNSFKSKSNDEFAKVINNILLNMLTKEINNGNMTPN